LERSVKCVPAFSEGRFSPRKQPDQERESIVVDVAVWMSESVLAHKLEARDEKNTTVTWNVARLPRGLGREATIDRLFVASAGRWRGYFVLSKEALWSPEDEAAPYALIVDTTTWTDVAPEPAPWFRGVRALSSLCGAASPSPTPLKEMKGKEMNR
jgi:hypothetical protein